MVASGIDASVSVGVNMPKLVSLPLAISQSERLRSIQYVYALNNKRSVWTIV